MNYGKELILDLHNCETRYFNRDGIEIYFDELCHSIKMEPCKLVWWDDLYTPKKDKVTEPHLVGTSAVQFIKTSNITIHTLDILKRVYVNIFSCKEFNASYAKRYTKNYFGGKIVASTIIKRI